jgi:hypothetical protein
MNFLRNDDLGQGKGAEVTEEENVEQKPEEEQNPGEETELEKAGVVDESEHSGSPTGQNPPGQEMEGEAADPTGGDVNAQTERGTGDGDQTLVEPASAQDEEEEDS